MKIKFTKMHGCGNDYIYINCFDKKIEFPGDLSRKLSDRRYGVGGDGVILICKSDKADAKMRIFNSDGSEGKMCGNGIRCVGKYLYDNNMVLSRYMNIDTLSGIKKVELYSYVDKKSILKVDMGIPDLEPERIPVNLVGDKIIARDVIIGKKQYNITCVSMGNPHCVIFCNDVSAIDVSSLGIEIEKSDLFPHGVNVEFVKVEDECTISLRVWERGSGETLACGTGACAGVVAAILNGFCKRDKDIKVKLRGGELIINYKSNGKVFMTGPAEEVYKGEVEV